MQPKDQYLNSSLQTRLMQAWPHNIVIFDILVSLIHFLGRVYILYLLNSMNFLVKFFMFFLKSYLYKEKESKQLIQ